MFHLYQLVGMMTRFEFDVQKKEVLCFYCTLVMTREKGIKIQMSICIHTTNSMSFSVILNFGCAVIVGTFTEQCEMDINLGESSLLATHSHRVRRKGKSHKKTALSNRLSPVLPCQSKGTPIPSFRSGPKLR